MTIQLTVDLPEALGNRLIGLSEDRRKAIAETLLTDILTPEEQTLEESVAAVDSALQEWESGGRGMRLEDYAHYCEARDAARYTVNLRQQSLQIAADDSLQSA